MERRGHGSLSRALAARQRGSADARYPGLHHPEFAESLRAARAAGNIGEDGICRQAGRQQERSHRADEQEVMGRTKFKKYAVMAGISEPRKSCTGVHKTRAEAAAQADRTESQMLRKRNSNADQSCP